jgi:hypothetical protein
VFSASFDDVSEERFGLYGQHPGSVVALVGDVKVGG